MGTALACVLAGKGLDVLLWAREAEVVDAVNAGAGNPRFLPGVTLPLGIAATTRLADLADCDPWLVVAPARPRWPLDPAAEAARGAGVKA